ncbi:MAG: hypothetical protein GXP03_07925 [Alphaproteobacteria bacterium]|nr:hypothetical protein [Alphaproteobacteria bacterium]
MEKGHAWRTTCWRKSRQALLPRMPLEVIRTRIKRAKAIGLDYKTYACVRNNTGRDIYAFLFSSNALRLHLAASDLPQDRANKLRNITSCAHLIAAHRPLDPATLPHDMAEQHHIDIRAAHKAPIFTESWSDIRARMTHLIHSEKIPADAILLIGETAFEREWHSAGKFAAFLNADTFFPIQGPTP